MKTEKYLVVPVPFEAKNIYVTQKIFRLHLVNAKRGKKMGVSLSWYLGLPSS